MFVPLKAKVPGPVLVHDPTPVIEPPSLDAVPASAKKVPPPGKRFTALSDVIPPPAGALGASAVKAQRPSPQIYVAVYGENAAVEICATAVAVRARQGQGACADLC